MPTLKERIEIWLGCRIYGHYPVSRDALTTMEKIRAKLRSRDERAISQQVLITMCARCGKRLK